MPSKATRRTRCESSYGCDHSSWYVSTALLISVYEMSVLMSLSSGNYAQLATTLTRLIQEIYPSVPEREGSRDVVVTLMHHLYPHNLYASSSLTCNFKDVRGMFACTWLLESLCSIRPGYLQEYLERRWYLSTSETSTMHGWRDGNMCLDFCHRVFHAMTRHTYQEIIGLLWSNDDLMGMRATESKCWWFWPRIFLRSLLPILRMRNTSILRKSYLQVPLSREVVSLIGNDQNPGSGSVRNEASVQWLETVMLFQPQLERDDEAHHMISCIGSVLGCTTWEEAVSSVRRRLRQTNDAWAMSWRA